MGPIVLDCSVFMAWVLGEAVSDDMERVLEQLLAQGITVPSIWSLEVVSVALHAVRSGRMTEHALAVMLAEIQGFPIRVDRTSHERALTRVPVLAKRHGLTGYDAAYLDLAIREGSVLATLDKKLAKAAAHEGVLVIPALAA